MKRKTARIAVVTSGVSVALILSSFSLWQYTKSPIRRVSSPPTPTSMPVVQPPPKVLGHQVHRSPDHSLTATVVSLEQQHPYGDNPSRIEIRDAGGHLLASRDHSLYPGQGYTVAKAAWTSDSRFFVYIVSNSGGHQPSYHPIFFYSRQQRKFYDLGKAVGSITGDLELRSPSSIITKARYFGENKKGVRTMIEPRDGSGETRLKIDLRRLELSPSYLSSDTKDRQEYEEDQRRDAGL